MFLLLALCLCKRRKRMKKTTTWIQTHSSSLNDCKLRHDAGRPAHRATSEFYSVCLSLTHTHTQRSKVKRQGTKIIIIIITPFFDCRHINDVAVSLCVCVYVLDVWPWTPPNGLVAWPSNCSIFTNDGLLLRFLLFLMWKAWAKDVGHAFFFFAFFFFLFLSHFIILHTGRNDAARSERAAATAASQPSSSSS